MSKNSSRHLVSFLFRRTVTSKRVFSPALLQKTSPEFPSFITGLITDLRMNKKKDKDSDDFDNLLSYFQSSNVTKIKEMQTKYLRVVEQEQFKSGAFSPTEICLVERHDDTIFERVAGEKMKDCRVSLFIFFKLPHSNASIIISTPTPLLVGFHSADAGGHNPRKSFKNHYTRERLLLHL